ncbi:protein N-terminal asparagine amidohydrolase-like [Ixodes scapularis]|uniref:protein N-terminal asparagine amidohydrolase-like n=1 Tax=Ixodes scapularis TaxID=6945 RepID=UPI001AD64268|nr:protein N-terminal asparagine amidohydrolase-like [Ixodes scapularis]
MPLVINGAVVEQLPPDTRTLLDSYPQFKEIAAALISQVPKVIGPLGLLYVNQRELAVTVPQDKNVSVLGTDEATTCLMAIVRHTGSGAVSLAHFDGSGLEQGAAAMVRRVQELSLPIPEGSCKNKLPTFAGV